MWLLAACTPDVLGLYESERNSALALATEQPRDWQPDLVVSISEPTLEEALAVGLRAALADPDPLRLALPLGLSAELRPRATVDRTGIRASDACPSCVAFDAKMHGNATWSVSGARGELPFSVAAEGVLRVTVADEHVRIEPYTIDSVRIDLSDSKGLRVDPSKELKAWLTDALRKELPAIDVIDLDRSELPVRALRLRTDGALRIEALTDVPGARPAATLTSSTGTQLAVSETALVGLARRAAFEKGVLAMDVAADPRALAVEGDRFVLSLRLWRLVGRGWWRDYEVTGGISVERGKLKLSPEGVREVAKSPGAALVDPLAALFQNRIVETIADVIDRSLPASRTEALGVVKLRAEAETVTGRDGTVFVGGSVEIRARMRRFRGVALGVCIALAIELAARLPDVPDPAAPPPSGDSIELHGNPWLLWELVPGTHAEQGVTVTVSPQGFRGPTRAARGGPRALVLGDSSAYGFGVPDDLVFSAVLEARTSMEFVNAAVPGYSSYQALNVLRMRGLALEPELLIVATLWSDNNFDAFTDVELLASYRGWEGTGEARLRRIAEHSALFRLLDWTLRVAPRANAARKVGWTRGGDERAGSRRVAIADYARNLDTFCLTMVERGGGVLFVLLPNRHDLGPPGVASAWEPYRQVMRDTAARWSAPLVSLPEVFRATGASAAELFLDDMHPSAVGHARMADAIGASLGSGWPVLAGSSGAIPTYTDPYTAVRAPRKEVAGPTLKGWLKVPQRRSGSVVIDLTAPGQRFAIGSAGAARDGPVTVQVREVPATVIVRATLDVAGDGPGAGDPFATLPPQAAAADGTLAMDFSRATFGGQAR